jgi:hypothetical protein
MARNEVRMVTERKPKRESETRQRRRGAQPRPSWHQHAGFSLFIDRSESRPEEWQTRIYHDESDEEVVLPGADLKKSLNWIAQHAEVPVERVEAPVETPAARPAGEEPPEVDIEVSEVMLSEHVEQTGLKKSLSAELHFNLSGRKAGDLAERHIPFRVETYAVDLESGDPRLVASEQGELQEAVFEYTAEQVFPVPDLGRYALHSRVVLLPPEEAIATYRGPVVEVIP